LKALIFSHENSGSYVMDCEGFFDYVKGFTKQPMGAEIEIADIPLRPPVTIMRVMSYAACFIVVISLSIFAYLWNTVNYFVYVDINPSVKMQFNGVNKLKTTLPTNEDVSQLLDGLKLSGSAAETVPALILAAGEKGYLNLEDRETAVLITVVARRGGSPDAFVSAIKAALDNHNMLGFISINGCSEDYDDRAASLGVSPGKLKMAEELMLASDRPLSLQEALKMPVKALFIAAREAETGIKPDEAAPVDSYNGNNNPNPNAGENNAANPGATRGNNPAVDKQAAPGANQGDDPGSSGQANTGAAPGGAGAVSPGQVSPGAGLGAISSVSAGPDSPVIGGSPDSAGQISPNPAPDNKPGSPADPSNSQDDSVWIADPINSSTGNNDKPGAAPDTGPGNDNQKNPNTGPGSNTGSGKGNNSQDNPPGNPEPKEPEKPTEGYVEPGCDKDGYWWFYNAAEDETSYTYNPGTALGHDYNRESIAWEEGLGWSGTCLRCGKTVFISADPNY